MRINQLADYFVPEKYLNDKELSRKSRFIIWFMYISSTIGLFFAVLAFAHNPEDISNMLIILTIIPLFIFGLFNFRKRGSFIFSAHFFCGTFFLGMLAQPLSTGGLYSPDLPTIYIIPIFAMIMGNVRIGLFYGFLSLAALVMFFVAGIKDYEYYFGLTAKLSPDYFYFNLTLNIVVILFLVFRNEILRVNLLLELKESNILVLEKSKEITDSITYAKNIQEAILPPIDLIKLKLPQTFVFYKPKDIVAGDFYWMEEIDDTILIAAADCTGHGVPGAMVSVVCSNALNRAVKEFRLSDPGAILDKVTDLVLQTFEKSKTEVKDGMDISLLSINKLKQQIQWSGANNPLWYFENAEHKEITADKQPVGSSDHRKPFTTHTISYTADTTFYLFTDGYADQFGGPKGKKFKYKKFQETIDSILDQEPISQQAALSAAFENWKGDLEQVDDVCVIGVRL